MPYHLKDFKWMLFVKVTIFSPKENSIIIMIMYNMRQKTKRKHPVPLEKYAEAFMQYFTCSKSDFEIKESYQDGPCLARFEDKIYCISSYHDIMEYSRMILKEKHLISSISPN